jgi:hypothetical protein
MKTLKILLFFVVVLSLQTACAPFAENNKRVEQLNQQMSADWLKTHVVPGKTTRDDVLALYGAPMFKTASAGTTFGSEFMPDEIWTYAVRFTKIENSWSGGSSQHWSRSIAFSFKNGLVSDYHVSESSF